MEVGDEISDGREGAQIERHDYDLGMGGGLGFGEDPGLGFVGGLEVAGGEDEAGACLGENPGGLGSNAGGGASDDGGDGEVEAERDLVGGGFGAVAGGAAGAAQVLERFQHRIESGCGIDGKENNKYRRKRDWKRGGSGGFWFGF